jgi:hypothetical protein
VTLKEAVAKTRTAHHPVHHPAHYTAYPVEVIELTEHLNFCLGNVVKYVARADHKGSDIEDLEKAAWYLEREIQRRKRAAEERAA